MARNSCSWRLAIPALRCHALPPRISSSLTRCLAAPFSTTTATHQPMPAKAKNPQSQKAGPPKRGEKQSRGKKKRITFAKGAAPAIGERKASKKRVVLSNVNALEVPGLEDLSVETSIDESLQNTILGLPGPLVDRLRALGAFKPTQSWGMYKRPAMLIRPETIEVAKIVGVPQSAETGQRLIITGERGSGKSVLLLQVMAMALMKDWVVITIPETSEITSARTEYWPVPDSKPVQYFQKTYVTQLLNRTAIANPILQTLKIQDDKTRALPHAENLQTLADLCKSAEPDPEQAWPIFEALWAELQHPGRPPLLLALDGLSHVMRHSEYRSSNYKLIHAHDLSLVSWYMGCLSGATPLANGGMVLAATSQSNEPSNKALAARLNQLEAEQAHAAGLLPHHPAKDPIAAFLAATGQSSSPIPQLDPYAAHDPRVLAVLAGHGGHAEPALTQSAITPLEPNPPAKRGRPKKQADPVAPEPTTAVSTYDPPRVLRCRGVDRAGARALMEYWARSGVLRQAVSAPAVQEAWVLSGGGVLGELERHGFGGRVQRAAGVM